MQKLAATSKNIDIVTTFCFFLTHVWLVFEKGYDKMKHVLYIKTQTQ